MGHHLIRAGIGALCLATLVVLLGTGSGQPQIPFPTIYRGAVTIAGNPAPDGIKVFARIADYQSPAVTVVSGRYGFGNDPLVVGPPSTAYIGKKVTFHATVGAGDVQAAESDTFSGGIALKTVNLTFATPPPTPVPSPTATPTGTPTPTPSLPIPGDPSVTQLPVYALAIGGAMVVLGILLLVARRRNAM